jgi:hypothetical protein
MADSLAQPRARAFWWPDGRLIGYTYQDRRGDTTIRELPWGEYSPCPTHLGIAGLDGAECYLSDPLNCYHSHLFVSPDGQWVCGEGTDGFSFAEVEELKNLLVMHLAEGDRWDWAWALKQFHANRDELVAQRQRHVGFATRQQVNGS